MKMYRQGDVLLIERGQLPEEVQKQKECILAYGEATGHHHQVKEHGVIWIDINDQGRRYLEIVADTKLVHEEHAPLALKGPAVFEVIIQKEYFPGAIRNVID